MATTIKEIYSDVDVSMEKNSYGDIPKTTNIATVRASLINRLMIPSAQLPFDNADRGDLRSFVNSEMDAIDKSYLTTMVRRAVGDDPRLTLIDLNTVRESDSAGADKLTVNITCEVRFANAGKQTVDFSFILNNY